MSTAPDAFSARIAALRAAFVERLPAQIEQLETLCRETVAGPLDAATLREARLAAHNLRGSTGTYDLTELSRAAGVLDDLFKAAESDALAADALRADLARALDALRAAFARSRGPAADGR